MFCENTLQKTFQLKTQFPNTFYILTGWNKVEGLVLNTKLILFPGNWRLFFGNHLFQLLAFVTDWHGAHQGEFAAQEWELCVLTAMWVWDVAVWIVGTCMWTWGPMSAESQQKRSQCRLQTLESHSTLQLCLTRAAQLYNAPPALTGSLLISAEMCHSFPHTHT